MGTVSLHFKTANVVDPTRPGHGSKISPVKAVQSKVGLCASNGPHSSATARAKIFSSVHAPLAEATFAAQEARERRIRKASWAMREIYGKK